MRKVAKRHRYGTALILVFGLSVAVALDLAIETGVLTVTQAEAAIVVEVVVAALVTLIFLTATWTFGPDISQFLERHGIHSDFMGLKAPSITVSPLANAPGYVPGPPGISGHVEVAPGVWEAQGVAKSHLRPGPSEQSVFLVHYWLDPVKFPEQKIPTSIGTPEEFLSRKNIKKAIESGDLRRIVAEFGVLKITNSGGNLNDCKARGKYQVGGKDAEWTDAGPLNWYSDDIKTDRHWDPRNPKGIKRLEKIRANPHDGLNRYLKNTRVDIEPGGEAFLPLFYTRLDYPHAFICGVPLPLRVFRDASMTTAFRMKIWIYGQSLERTLFEYDIEIGKGWGEYSIHETTEVKG